MKAIGYFTPGAIDRDDALVDLEIPAPTPAPRDLLVRVKAISVNPVDTKFRAGSNPPAGEAKVLGWDAAGVVEGVGSDVTLFKVGNEVFYAGDMMRPGTNSEFHVVDERLVGHKPKTLDWAAAAALPLTSLTAWELLFERLRVPFGDKSASGSLLVINGAGGVGSILIQMARRLTGLTVIATASRPDSIAWTRKMGAHHVIDHHQPLDTQLAEFGVPQVDYVASLTGSDRQLPIFPSIIAPHGHLAIIDDPEHFDIVTLKRKSITVSWELMFTRAAYQTDDMIAQHKILEEVSALIDSGVLVTTMTRSETPINAANLKLAHALAESGRAIGKIALADF